MSEITLRSSDGTAFVTLDSFRPSRDGAHFELVVQSRGFSARTGYSLEADEFRALVEGLQQMYDTLSGSAEVRIHREEDHVRFEMNARGQVLVTGLLCHYQEPCHRFEFGFFSDQSCLPSFVRALSLAGSVITGPAYLP